VVDESAIRERYGLMGELLNERSRRRWAAAEARSHGRGGVAAVARATGMSESTVRRGLAELDAGEELGLERVRRAGAGRPGIVEREPGLSEALDGLIDPVTRGDPESPLRWTSQSGAKLAGALCEMGYEVVDRTVLRLLRAKGYSLQANKEDPRGRAASGS
jgi:Rhodopirellula transposase DDE domain